MSTIGGGSDSKYKVPTPGFGESGPGIPVSGEMKNLQERVNSEAASVFGKSYEAKRAAKFIATPLTGGLSYMARGIRYLGAVAADEYARSTIISGPAGIDAAKIARTEEELQKIQEVESQLQVLREMSQGNIGESLKLAVSRKDYSNTEKALKMLVHQIGSSGNQEEVKKLKEFFNKALTNAVAGPNSRANQKIISLLLKFPMLVSDWNKLSRTGATVSKSYGREKLIKDAFAEVFKKESFVSSTEIINPQFKEMLKFPELIPQDYWSSPIFREDRVHDHITEVIEEADRAGNAQLISRLIEHIPSSVMPWGNVYDTILPQNQSGIKAALEEKVNKDFLSDVMGSFITTDVAIQGHPEMVDWVKVIQTIDSMEGRTLKEKEDMKNDVLAVLDKEITKAGEARKAGEEPEAILQAARLQIDASLGEYTGDIGKYIDVGVNPAVMYEKLFEVVDECADKYPEVEEDLSKKFHSMIEERVRSDSSFISKLGPVRDRIDWKQILSEDKGLGPLAASSAAAPSKKPSISTSEVATAALTAKPADSLTEDQKKQLVTQTIIDSLQPKEPGSDEFVDQKTARKLLQFPQYINVNLIEGRLGADEAMHFFVNQGIQSTLARDDLSEGQKEAKIKEFLNNENLVSYVDWAKIEEGTEDSHLQKSLKGLFNERVEALINRKSIFDIQASWESCIKCRWFEDAKIEYSNVFEKIKMEEAKKALKEPFHEALLHDPEIINESNYSYVDWTLAFGKIDASKKNTLGNKFNDYLVSLLGKDSTKKELINRLLQFIADNKEQVNWPEFNGFFEKLKEGDRKQQIRLELQRLLYPDLQKVIESDMRADQFQKWIEDRSSFIEFAEADNLASRCARARQEMLVKVLTVIFPAPPPPIPTS